MLAWDVLLVAAARAAQGLGARMVTDSGVKTLEGSAERFHVSDGRRPTSGLVVGGIGAPRSEVGLFVELLVFGALLVGFVATPLLGSVFGASMGAGDAKGAGSEAGDGGARGWRGAAGPRTAATAALLAATAAAAVLPAAWALEFALATRRRVAVLSYWALLLVVALPLMDWVSRGRRVPTIIVRKVLRPSPCYCLIPLRVFSMSWRV
jgi:hypothetical protein